MANRSDDGPRRPVVDWPLPPAPGSRRIPRWPIALGLLVVAFVGGGTAISWYVEALWFDSLGFNEVFWRTLSLEAAVFLLVFALSFGILYTALSLLRPHGLGGLTTFRSIVIGNQPLSLAIEPLVRRVTLLGSIVFGLISGAGIAAEWPAIALYWYGRGVPTATSVDPIFNKPLGFYLFTLPVWQIAASWLITIALVVLAAAIFFLFLVIGGNTRTLAARRGPEPEELWRGVSAAAALVLLVFAFRVYLVRYELLFDDHTIFSGVTYTDAHVTIPGLGIVSAALVIGAAAAALNALRAARLRWLLFSLAPTALAWLGMTIASSYVNAFEVKPNELVRESPFIAHNIAATRDAFVLSHVVERPFPADAGTDAIDLEHNQATLQNIRLWDWHALQDTLRQIQEIRTYYDFPDIDIDRYETGGSVRQMMLATRELNTDKLPESSRNWINDKLIYTHGYGVTMNPVNGFTSEGMPQLVLRDMPIQSTLPEITVSRPEIYFGELTNSDVYVKTGQKEFNYPQGATNNLATYAGSGGIELGSFVRRLLIALDRGDLAKLPFSDDVSSQSRLLMRRNVRERALALAPFLTLDPDPYIVVGKNGRLYWFLDGYTTANTYPYASHYQLGRDRLNYLRNSVKIVIDAYDGSATLYVFDDADPIVQAYRRMYPKLFTDGASMPDWMRAHVRYPELLLEMQALVYGLYHMADPAVFYNREDLWTVASDVSASDRREGSAKPVEPNFIMMKLPGEKNLEFVEILPLTPANRNNLIGWIAGRSDGDAYGSAIVYTFPKTKLVDGPLQIDARINQNAQLSSQLTLWNQQGSKVLRGSLLVIPIGRGLLYAESIFLQSERSPMPELRVVVLALQDRLAYGPSFEAAMAGLFGDAGSQVLNAGRASLAGTSNTGASNAGTSNAAASNPGTPNPGAPNSGASNPNASNPNAANEPARTPATSAEAPAAPGTPPANAGTSIADAARDLSDYQRLTAEGKLGEAGQKLEALKHKLDQLNKR